MNGRHPSSSADETSLSSSRQISTIPLSSPSTAPPFTQPSPTQHPPPTTTLTTSTSLASPPLPFSTTPPTPPLPSRTLAPPLLTITPPPPPTSTSAPTTTTMPPPTTPPKKWRKILYEDSGYPDNHVDASFLDEMRKNISTRLYSRRRVVVEAEVVSRQLSCVSLFIATFAFLSLEWASPNLVLGVVAAASASGFLLYCATAPDPHAAPDHRRRRAPVFTLANFLSVLHCVPYLALCYGLSPILITLTRTISGDTLYAMTALMLFAYLLFYDYRPSAGMTSSPVSLNAAIFASVCLASRLPSVVHTFAIVSVALATFALWPALHRRLGTLLPPLLLHASTVGLVAVSTAVVSYVSAVGSWLLLGSHLVIVVFCPLLFVRLQKDKHNIYGPWDEAVIRE